MVINIYEQICALFMRARNWKPPKNPVLWKWVCKSWYIFMWRNRMQSLVIIFIMLVNYNENTYDIALNKESRLSNYIISIIKRKMLSTKLKENMSKILMMVASG